MSRRLAVLVLGAMVVLASCGGVQGEASGGTASSSSSAGSGSSTTTAPPAALISGVRWMVTGLQVDGTLLQVPEGSGLFIVFDVVAGQVTGSGGCNGFGGNVEFDGSGLAISDVVSTLIGCEPGISERETSFFNALAKVAGFALDGEDLTLFSTDRSTVISSVAEPSVSARALGGTEWHLNAILEGEVSVSVVAGTDPTLLVDQDAGTLSGSTGCNTFGGAAVVESESITITDLVATKMACTKDGVMGEESAILDILGRAVTWGVEGDRLLITADDGRSLEYRAG